VLIAMQADPMARFANGAGGLGRSLDAEAEPEEAGGDLVASEYLEQLLAIAGVGAVVEGQGYLRLVGAAG
jgi:hypothetical protein